MSELSPEGPSASPPEPTAEAEVPVASGEELNDERTILQRLGDVARGVGPKEYVAAGIVVAGAVTYLLARRKGWLQVSEGHALSLSKGDKHSAGLVSVVEISSPLNHDDLAASFPTSRRVLDDVRDGAGVFSMNGKGEFAHPQHYAEDVPRYAAAVRALAGRILRAWPRDASVASEVRPPEPK